MTQETINNEVQLRLSVYDEKFNSLITKIDATNEKVDNLISEMRDRDNRRADEISEIRKKNDELNVKIDEKFEKILSQMQSMAIAAVVGVGAIVVGVMSIMKP